MTPIKDVSALQAIYGEPSPRSIIKVVKAMTPLYRQWIEACRLVMISTVGPEGTDCSPRGDVGPVVRIADDKTLLLPDWQGNNRVDTLSNIVRDERVSLMFIVPGSTTVVRVNGTAIVTADADLCQSFEQRGKHPRTIVVITIGEMYTQCAKALLRSETWTSGDQSHLVPTAGQIAKERDVTVDAAEYDRTYVENAQDRMW